MKKILIILTNHNLLGNTGKSTGAYLSEFTHPYSKFIAAEFEVEFASPIGGDIPIIGINLEDPINKMVFEDSKIMEQVHNSVPLSEIDTDMYDGVFLAGGHGTVWDFAHNKILSNIVEQMYLNHKVVGAVCHGVAGLLGATIDNEPLVKGKKINCFTNEEEIAVELDSVVPYLLETKLIEAGALFEKSPNFEAHVAVDDRLVTGQNPKSASLVAQKMIELILLD
jgi:putative intracellular protease/amidase